MREKKERREEEREREGEEEKGRESPVTPDEDKTGAWRDGPKAQWGCPYASFLTLLLDTKYICTTDITIQQLLQDGMTRKLNSF